MSHIAVLIDAENVLPIFSDQIMTHAASLGEVTVREIYGAAPSLTVWVSPVLKYALHSNLTIKASKYKNTSDIALVIGAMDLMINRSVDTVVIASSDSDFSMLSVRLRSAGIEVVGMGTEKTNPLWRTACSTFVVLQQPTVAKAATSRTITPSRPAQPAKTIAPALVTPAPAQPAVTPAPAPAGELAPRAERQPTPAVSAPAPAEEAPAPSAEQQAVKTHNERVAIIREFIRKTLAANGNSMSVSNLFHALNNLQEYHVDQLGSRRKPLNYLTSMFSDEFQFTPGENGLNTISLKAETPKEEAPVNAVSLETSPAEPAPTQAEKKPARGKKPTAAPAEKAAAEKTPAENQSEEKTPVGKAPAKKDWKSQTAEAALRASQNNGAPSASAQEERPAEKEKPLETTPKTAPASKSTAKQPKSARNTPRKKEKPAPDLSAISLHDIGLQQRPLTTLISQGYHTLADVAALSDTELMSIKNIGVVTVDQIRAAVKKA